MKAFVVSPTNFKTSNSLRSIESLVNRNELIQFLMFGCSTWNKLINRNHERGGEMHKFGISEWVVVSTKGGGGSEKVALFHIRYNYHDRIQHLSSRAFGAKDRRQGRRNKRGDINFLF